MLRFFYLVRLTQQGLFHLISSSYPALEPQAIIHLADKLVAGSMGGATSMLSSERTDARRTTRRISFNLYKELDEPIAEGFKTTYKDIMQAANCLGGERSYEQRKNEQSQHNNQSDVTQASATEVATTGIPPIWVVVPYCSMMDSSNFALSGNLPSLPFTSSLFIPTPNTNHKNKNNNSSKNVENNKLEQQIDSKKENVTNEIRSNDKQSLTTNQNQNETVVNNNENKDNISEYKDNSNEIKNTHSENKDSREGKEEEEENEDDDEDVEEEGEGEGDDDDRFADAYSSDDDNELEDVQEKALISKKIEDLKEEAPEEKKENVSKTKIDTENNTTTATITPSSAEKDLIVPSQWQNFAASCHGNGDSNVSSLSPRRSSPKSERK